MHAIKSRLCDKGKYATNFIKYGTALTIFIAIFIEIFGSEFSDFTMTINKSQGQSLKVVGLNLEEVCFSHGQLYVGGSRIGNPKNLNINCYNPLKKLFICIYCIGMETSIEILEQQTGQQVGQTPKSLFKFVYSLLTRFKKPYLFMCFFLNLIINLICSVFFYFITGILFLVFLYKNEGIVVGDKSAHEACINFPQLGYFLSFMLVSCLPQMISVDLIKQFFISIWNNVIITTLLTVAACLLIKEFTYVHPYTLADNRHLTFYVWKWIYERHDLIRFLDLVLWEPTKGNRRGKKTINFIDNLKSTHLEEIEEIVTVMKSRDVWKELVKLGGVRARPK
ncbi:putative Dol-P-Glc:Glc(2)Man(9)GlcNAc(2)-PP-Dol alpha-1,2-glucosyltransferase [Nymphon striatum]|nr:putative Dol-P-Glc:Glc(2)Man(9)GlcNAc(2)-PP-Dol alpha-1,2-glucosyltransferase [Nymphon striatum]